MLFNSLEFIIFLPIVLSLYFVIPHRFRWIFLLIASYYFYMCWEIEYIILIVSSTLVAYISAIQIEKHSETIKKKIYLTLCICFNLGLLFGFKYFNFLTTLFVPFSANLIFSIIYLYLNYFCRWVYPSIPSR